MATSTPSPQCHVKNDMPIKPEMEKRISHAREIIKKFPVTKEMFPQVKYQSKWIVSK